jgi:hypothetical protein
MAWKREYGFERWPQITTRIDEQTQDALHALRAHLAKGEHGDGSTHASVTETVRWLIRDKSASLGLGPVRPPSRYERARPGAGCQRCGQAHATAECPWF